MPDTKLVALFKLAIPHWRQLPAGCAVTESLYGQNDYEDVLAVLEEAGALADFAERLRRTHPQGRTHQVAWDDGLWDLFAEAEAFAWAERAADLGRPEFTDDEGKPDLWVPLAGAWVEAKRINESDDEKAASRALGPSGTRGPVKEAAPHPGFMNKIRSQLADALAKRRRVGGGDMYLFLDVFYVDFGVRTDLALAQVEQWAGEAAANTGMAIVACFNHSWDAPFVQTGTPH